ncbi:MAG: DinB family protein [Acidobacteriota bacterium]
MTPTRDRDASGDPTANLDPRVDGLRTQLRLNTRLFARCFDGVDDDLAWRRVAGEGRHEANGMAFLGVHLAQSRHTLARILDRPTEDPFPGLAQARGASGNLELPPVAQILAAWARLGESLDRTLAELDPAVLDRRAPYDFPVQGDDPSLLGGLAFLLQHEAYHLGQMGMLRRLLGLDAMRYA